MKTYFKDGKTVCDAQAYENVMYDVANNGISVRFDGKGCVTRYSVLNEGTQRRLRRNTVCARAVLPA